MSSCQRSLSVTLSAALLAIAQFGSAHAAAVRLQLQSRDPQSGQVVVTPWELDPAKTGIVVIDIWNWHWCKTATQRVAALVPRMDSTLRAARELGIQVFLCPTDAVESYVGTPQRERVMALRLLPLPESIPVECPTPPMGPGCGCGREKCKGNYGWDGMHPALTIGPDDLMPNSQQALYTLCAQRGIEHLIFMGVHTQVCLLGKSVGLRSMKSLGFRCLLARDLTDSHPDYDPQRKIDPDDLTRRTVEHFEQHLCPTVKLYDAFRAAGLCPRDELVDPVRLAPWGTRARPHLFEQPITVTLAAPLQPGATIHYSTDGSDPTPTATRYLEPLTISDTTSLRANAFVDGLPVCTETEGVFVKLPPRPPAPDRYLGDLVPLRASGPGHSPQDSNHRYSLGARPPQTDTSNQGRPLRLRGQDYQRGLGVHAPNQILYQLQPEFRRFVALAGVDERLLEVSNGSNVARYPSVVFRVFIDGELASESPAMRISCEPWRFDVPIPAGAQRICITATDAGDGNRHDLANWVEAGFIVSAK